MKKHFLLMLIATTLLVSCKKNKEDKIHDAKDISQTAADQALIENEFNSVFESTDAVLREDPNFKSVNEALPACATLTKDSVNKIITIDYGTINCSCNDGLMRRGKVIIHHTGKYRKEGAEISINLENYFVNDNQVQGSKTITNLGNSSGNYKFRYTVSNASISFKDGSVKSWNKVAEITRVEGEGTNTPFDDVFMVTGTSSGETRKGRAYTAVTTTPLKKRIQIGCARNFVSGIITVTDAEGNTLVLDYDPTKKELCDKLAQVVINGGEPRIINLR